MVKITVGFLVLCTLLAVAALSLIDLAWVGLIILGVSVATLVVAYLLERLDERPRRMRVDSGIRAGAAVGASAMRPGDDTAAPVSAMPLRSGAGSVR